MYLYMYKEKQIMYHALIMKHLLHLNGLECSYPEDDADSFTDNVRNVPEK